MFEYSRCTHVHIKDINQCLHTGEDLCCGRNPEMQLNTVDIQTYRQKTPSSVLTLAKTLSVAGILSVAEILSCAGIQCWNTVYVYRHSEFNLLFGVSFDPQISIDDLVV